MRDAKKVLLTTAIVAALAQSSVMAADNVPIPESVLKRAGIPVMPVGDMAIPPEALEGDGYSGPNMTPHPHTINLQPPPRAAAPAPAPVKVTPPPPPPPEAQPNFPSVPVAVMTKPKPVAAPTQTPAATEGQKSEQDESRLVMKPGVNELIPVSRGHLNRFVTPFSTPKVTTTSAATTEIRDNVIYVAPEGTGPVTMFVTEKGSESQALSLTLIPRSIPPRELTLELDKSVGWVQPVNKRAETWETSQPYIQTLRSVFRALALGEMPQGYTIHSMPPEVVPPSCRQAGLSFDFLNGQYAMGQNLTVLIGVVTNTGNSVVEIKEASCGGWDVAAVAAWPRNMLAPGEASEVFVARKVHKKEAPTSRRPSLLRRAN